MEGNGGFKGAILSSTGELLILVMKPAGVGAPTAVMTLEELVVWGTRKFMSPGAAGDCRNRSETQMSRSVIARSRMKARHITACPHEVFKFLPCVDRAWLRPSRTRGSLLTWVPVGPPTRLFEKRFRFTDVSAPRVSQRLKWRLLLCLQWANTAVSVRAQFFRSAPDCPKTVGIRNITHKERKQV